MTTRCWRTLASCNRSRSLIGSYDIRTSGLRSLTPKTSYKIPGEFCDCSVRQSGWILTTRCSLGRPDCARRTGFGRNIGMAKWQDRHRSNRISQRMNACRSACAKFTNAAANVTNGFINTDCTEEFSSADYADLRRFGFSESACQPLNNLRNLRNLRTTKNAPAIQREEPQPDRQHQRPSFTSGRSRDQSV